MKLRFFPLLWIVWVPLFSPGALPQPAVVAAVAGPPAMTTYAPTATRTRTAIAAPIQGLESLRSGTVAPPCGGRRSIGGGGVGRHRPAREPRGGPSQAVQGGADAATAGSGRRD